MGDTDINIVLIKKAWTRSRDTGTRLINAIAPNFSVLFLPSNSNRIVWVSCHC